MSMVWLAPSCSALSSSGAEEDEAVLLELVALDHLGALDDLLVLLGDVLLLEPRAVLGQQVEADGGGALGGRIELDRDRHQAEAERQGSDGTCGHGSLLKCDPTARQESLIYTRLRQTAALSRRADRCGPRAGSKPRIDIAGAEGLARNSSRPPTGPSFWKLRYSRAVRDRPLRAAFQRHQLLPRHRHRHAHARAARAPRTRPRWSGRGRCGCSRRRSCRPGCEPPLLATKRGGIVRARCCTTACENALTTRVVRASGASGTTTCRPLPPLVLSQLCSCSSSQQRAHQQRGLLQMRPGHAFAGVEVEDHPVGLVDALRAVEFQVWNSMVFICAAASSASARSTASSAPWPGQSAGSSMRHARHARLRMLLEEELAGDAVGRPHQRHRPAGAGAAGSSRRRSRSSAPGRACVTPVDGSTTRSGLLIFDAARPQSPAAGPRRGSPSGRAARPAPAADRPSLLARDSSAGLSVRKPGTTRAGHGRRASIRRTPPRRPASARPSARCRRCVATSARA